jgi:hypothetical protein
VTCPIINGTGAADCMDVGPTNGETGALKPPKEISSVVAPSEKELFIFYLDDTFFHEHKPSKRDNSKTNSNYFSKLLFFKYKKQSFFPKTAIEKGCYNNLNIGNRKLP